MKSLSHSLRGQARGAHQFIGADALVGVGLDQRLADFQQLPPVLKGNISLLELGLRLRRRTDPQRRREHLHPVLLPGQQHRFLQPGDGSTQPGVVGGGVPLEGIVLILAQNLPGGGHHLPLGALPPVQVPQRLQDAVNLLAREAGTGGHAELALHVLLGVEQHAPGRLLVPSGPARFLQVVLQRPGNVGVNHQPDVGLVDAHAEGVGGDDGPQVAVDEALLHGLLGFRRQAGVEVVGLHSLGLQELRQFFGVAPRRAVDYGAAKFVLLSGLAKCKTCNTPLIGRFAQSGKYSYYVCQSNIKLGRDACETPTLNARRFEELVVNKIRSNILTEGNIRDLVKGVAEEMDGVTREQRKRLETIEDELEDVKRKLGRIWHFIETSDAVMADASDRIREHRERQERLEYFAEQARAVLAQRRKVLDDVNTIAAYAKDMKDFLKESELTERRAFIQSFIKEIVVVPGDALLRYTVPMPDDSLIPGRAAEKVALNGSVLSTLPEGGRPGTGHRRPPIPRRSRSRSPGLPRVRRGGSPGSPPAPAPR